MSVPNLQTGNQAGPMLLEQSFALGDDSIQILQANNSLDSLDVAPHLLQTNASSSGIGKQSQSNKRAGMRKKSKIVQQPPRELTEEEKRQLEKQKKQADYLAELELLVSDDCPKSHPFDFRLIDLAEIKQIFPENATRQKAKKTGGDAVEKYIDHEPYGSRNPKHEGIEISELIKHFAQIMKLRPDNVADRERLQELAEKLDNKSEERITWKEFLRFLDSEGLRREMVNDAQLYGVSVKRLEEFSRKSLKESKNQQETFIENCVFINHGKNFKFLLCLFDKKARIFDTKTYAIVQELTYKSGYDLASQTRLFEEQQRAAAEAAQNAARENEQMATVATDKAQRYQSLEASSKHKKSGMLNTYHTASHAGTEQPADDDKVDRDASNRSSQYKFGLNLAPASMARSQSGTASQLNTGSSHSRRQFFRAGEAKEIRIKSYSQQRLRASGAVKTRMAQAAYALKHNQKLTAPSAKDLAQQMHQQVGFQGSAYSYSNLKSQKLPALSKNNDADTIAYEIMNPAAKKNAAQAQKDRELQQAKMKQFLMNKNKSRRQVKAPKEQRWVLGVLGHKPLTDNENARGLFSTTEKDTSGRGFGMEEIIPDLKPNFEKAQNKYLEKEKALDRALRVGEETYQRLKREREEKEALAGIAPPSPLKYDKVRETTDKRIAAAQHSQHEAGDKAQKKKPYTVYSSWLDQEDGSRPKDARDDAVEIMREQRAQILRQRQNAEARIKALGGGIDDTAKDLNELSYTNEHFYRRSSPSPRTIAYQQYLKRQLQNKGVDIDNQMEVTKQLNAMGVKADIQTVRNITETLPEGVNEKNYCSPDKIARYVEELKKDAPKSKRSSKLQQQQADPFRAPKASIKKDTYEDNQVPEKNAFKEVYALCATYNEELGILAVSLIDKQIKVYRIKQNGAKVQFQESFSFWANYYITCVCIARCVENSRPLLCMGAQSGDIQIVYLDEQVLDPTTKKPTGEVCAKEHPHSPFSFFNQTVAPPKKPRTSTTTQNEDKKKTDNRQTSLNSVSSRRDLQITNLHTNIDSTIVEETGHGSEDEEQTQGQRVPAAPVQQQPVEFEQVVGERVDDEGLEEDSDEYGSSQSGRRVKIKPEPEPPRDLTPQELVDAYAAAFDFDSIKKNRKMIIERQKQRKQRPAFDDTESQQPEPVKPVSRQQKMRMKAPVPHQSRRTDQPQRPSRNQWEQVRITAVRYVRDIGLIASAFNGTIKFFDPFDYTQQYQSNNDDHDRKEEYHTNITHFAISEKLSLLATGGAEGKLLLIDPYAQGVIKCVKAHHESEILQVYIYDEQQQIMTIAADRTVGVWNTRLEKIQSIRDTMEKATKFSSSCFDPRSGKLFVCCTKINVWKARVDQNVEIRALQSQNLSKNVLRQRKMLEQQDPLYDPTQVKPGAWRLRDTDARTGSVLVTSASTLVEIIINKQQGSHQFVITIDSENLLRVWDTRTSTTTTTFQIACFGRVTAATVDDDNRYLAIGTSFGEAKVINLRSGGILYELKTPNKFKLKCLEDGPEPESPQHEISFLKFSKKDGLTEFWLFAGCWGGQLLMWNRPTDDNNFSVDVRSARAKRLSQNHRGDIISLDRSEHMIVSGDDQGLINIWNALTGEYKHGVRLADKVTYERAPGAEDDAPKSLPGTRSSFKSINRALNNVGDSRQLIEGRDVRRSIVGICFHPFYDNLICVLQESGHIHVLDGTNGDVPYPNVQHTGALTQQINSNWACDYENQRMFVIGDSGYAVLYDISMRAPDNHQAIHNVCNGKTAVSRKNAPDPHWLNSEGLRKWQLMCRTFKAHDISGMDGTYVVTAKHAPNAHAFVTGTTAGEVRLWSDETCDPLGTLNAEDWDPQALQRQMSGLAPLKQSDVVLDEPELQSEGE